MSLIVRPTNTRLLRCLAICLIFTGRGVTLLACLHKLIQTSGGGAACDGLTFRLLPDHARRAQSPCTTRHPILACRYTRCKVSQSCRRSQPVIRCLKRSRPLGLPKRRFQRSDRASRGIAQRRVVRKFHLVERAASSTMATSSRIVVVLIPDLFGSPCLVHASVSLSCYST